MSREIEGVRRAYKHLSGLDLPLPLEMPQCGACDRYGFPVLYRVAPFWVLRCACGLRVARITQRWAMSAWRKKCTAIIAASKREK